MRGDLRLSGGREDVERADGVQLVRVGGLARRAAELGEMDDGVRPLFLQELEERSVGEGQVQVQEAVPHVRHVRRGHEVEHDDLAVRRGARSARTRRSPKKPLPPVTTTLSRLSPASATFGKRTTRPPSRSGAAEGPSRRPSPPRRDLALPSGVLRAGGF